jgi:hypothetical protein
MLSRSLIAPSVMRPPAPFEAIRAHSMSPKIPASVIPEEATTATAPSGISSMAKRVDFGDDSDSGSPDLPALE